MTNEMNGFDLSSFDGMKSAQEEGVPVEILHPATGEPVGATIVVAGPDSSRAKSADRAMIDRRIKKQKIQKLSAEELQTEGLTKLAACVISWEGVVADGVALECTVQNVLDVFMRAPWIAEQVAESAADRAAFFTN